LNPNQGKTERFRIGDIELDTGTASVFRAKTAIDLPKLSFDLLLCLARHAPNVVDTDTLMNEVWGKVVVGEETVKQRVKLLRQSLGDSSIEPKYLASVRGRGYRLIATVTRLDEPAGGIPAASRSRRRLVVAAIVIITVLAGGLMLRLQQLDTPVPAQLAEKNARAKRIAVLPFDNFSQAQDNEYLADGITEDITSALAQIDGLSVIARTTMMPYKNSGSGIAEIASELDVGIVLEGSIQGFGDDLRVTVQMIDALTEEHYWAQNYDIGLAKLPEMQISIAEQVAASLKATVSKAGVEALQRGSTESAAAYDAYLKGRDHYRRWTNQDNETALAFYQRAIELDPGFALARAGIANTYAMRSATYGAGDEWAAKAIEQAQLALAINPSLPEAYKALGISSFHHGFYQHALNHYLKALELNPGYDETLFNIAEIYHLLGQWDEAVRYQLRDSERAFGAERLSIYLRDLGLQDEADRLSTRASVEVPVSYPGEESLSLHFLLTGDYEQARSHSARMRTLLPGIALSWQRAGDIELAAGDPERAQEYMEKAVALADASQPYPKLRLAHLLLLRGKKDNARALLDEAAVSALQNISNGHEAWFYRWIMAATESLRGNSQASIDWYEKAVEAGRRRHEWDEWDPVFDGLRNEPGFRAALEKQRQLRWQMRERAAVMTRLR